LQRGVPAARQSEASLLSSFKDTVGADRFGQLAKATKYQPPGMMTRAIGMLRKVK